MLQIVVVLFGNLIGILFLNERAYYAHYKYKLMKGNDSFTSLPTNVNQILETEKGETRMTKYFVKVEVATYYDKNYEVEATDEVQAGNIVKSIAEKEYKQDQDLSDWEFGVAVHEVIYVEEAY